MGLLAGDGAGGATADLLCEPKCLELLLPHRHQQVVQWSVLGYTRRET